MFHALAAGWRLLKRHKKAVLLYYLSNLLAASLLLALFMPAFEQSLGPGEYRERLVERLDYDWYELFRDRAGRLAWSFSPSVTGFGPFARNLDTLLTGRWGALPREVLALGLLYLLINCFLTAAAVGSAAVDPKGTPFREFFRTGGEFFGRFFRLSLLSLACFWALYGLATGPLQAWLNQFSEAAGTDRTAFLWGFSGLLLGGMLLGWLNLVLDYSKVITAVSDRSSVVLAFFSAFFFCATHAFPVAGLYLLLSLLGLVWVGVMTGLEGVIPQSTGLAILAAVGVQQLYLLGRLTLRFTFYTSQMEFYLRYEGLYRPGEPLPREEEARSETQSDDSPSGKTPAPELPIV